MKIRSVFLSLTLILLSAAGRNISAQQNIVFIHMEDMGTEIGPYGDHTVPTPALDRLAAEGLTFVKGAFVTAGSCAPSRGSLFTGLYPHQNGIFAFDGEHGWHFREGCQTYILALREKGYYCGRTYKTGVTPNSSVPFDFSTGYRENRKEGTDTEYLTTNSIDNFEVFLQTRPRERPFYFQAQTPDTHAPWNDAKKRVFIKGDSTGHPYGVPDRSKITGPVSMGEDLILTGGVLNMLSDYYCAIQRTDYYVNCILELIDSYGLADSTIVIFSSDHGPSEVPAGKLYPYEFGSRVPFIVRWPGHTQPGSRTEALASFVDLMPTFLEIAGVEIPGYLPGYSLVPVFNGESQGVRRYIFTAYNSHTSQMRNYWPARTIRDGRYKLVHNLLGDGSTHRDYCSVAWELFNAASPPNSLPAKKMDRITHPPEFELYDLEKDPGEMVNLICDPEYVEVQSSLMKELYSWRSSVVVDPFLDPQYLEEFTAHITEQYLIYEEFRAAYGWNTTEKIQLDMEKFILPWDPDGYGKDPSL